MIRQFRRNPWFSAAAVVSLAVGLGAATAAWGVVEALLLRSPGGIGEPERVVDLGRTVGGRGFDSFSYPEIADLRSAPSLESVAGWAIEPMSLATGGAAERITAMAVSPSYFGVMGLGAAPAGRYFGAEADVSPGAHAVAVLGHRLWLERFGGDGSVVGRTILLNRHPFEVVGVAPADFRGHQAGMEADVYVPILMMGVVRARVAEFEARRSSWVRAVGRLASGVSVESANADLRRVFEGLRPIDPALYEHRSVAGLPLRAIPGGVRADAMVFLGLLLGLVGLVLLTTCANVAGMLLARSAAREKEIAVRLAIGAGRGRLVRQLLGESLALFAAGGAAGLLLAVWILNAIAAVELPVGPVPVRLDLAPNLAVFAAGLGVALLTGTLFGLAPALHSTRPDLVAALKGLAARGGRARLRRTFVAAQVGLSLALLLAAGLFLRSLDRAGAIETGFDGTGVQTIAFDLSIDGYDRERGLPALGRILNEARALPGLAAAGFAQDLPLDLSINETSFYPDDGAGTVADGGVGAAFVVASDGYLEALRIPVLRGRAFAASDRAESEPVALVSRAFADRVWPGDEAVGKRVRFATRDAEPRTIVGVVEDVKHQSYMEAAQPTVYLPVAQVYQPALTLVARSATAEPPSERALADAIRRVDPALSLSAPASLDGITAVGLLPQRMASIVATTLGLLAALLAALGVYGVVAFQVARRTREIGIRTALGADRRDVIRHVVAGGIRVAAPGLVLGTAAGLAIGRIARGFILGVPPADPITFVAAPAAMILVLLAAMWTPARRAARIEPVRALRIE